jgi:hypothetical protein
MYGRETIFVLSFNISHTVAIIMFAPNLDPLTVLNYLARNINYMFLPPVTKMVWPLT